MAKMGFDDKTQKRNELRKLLRKAEIKRVGERLTKKELCNIYGFNYNFYMNCVSNRNQISEKMAEQLTGYLITPTEKVHVMVFASREKEVEYHEMLEIEEKEANQLLEKLAKDNIFKEPVA